MDNNSKRKTRWYPGKYLGRPPPRSKGEDVETTRLSSVEDLSDNFNVNEDDDLAQSCSNLAESSSNTEDLIGTIIVTVVDVKYLRINTSKLYLELDDFSVPLHLPILRPGIISSQSPNPSVITLPLKELVIDLKIFVTGKMEDGELVTGVVVLPVTNLLNFWGKPLPPKELWMQFYPIGQHRLADRTSFKFESGYQDLNGYAMNRRKDPLGFICLQCELNIGKTALKHYIMKGKYGWAERSMQLLVQDQNESVENSPVQEDNNNSTAELCARISRDLRRIWQVLKMPLIISPALSLPEALIFNTVFIMLCLSVTAWLVPLLGFCFLLINGVMSSFQKRNGSVIIWNDPIPPTLIGASVLPVPSDPLMFLVGVYGSNTNAAMHYPRIRFADICTGFAENEEEALLVKTLLQQNSMLRRTSKALSSIAHNCEVVCNALNFSDPRISILLYSLLFVLATASSIAILLSVRIFVGSAVAVATLSVACSGIVIDLAHNRSSKGRNVLTAALLTVMESGAGLISRVPDELELIHRYIVTTSLANPKGSELIDASIAFEALMKAKLKDR